MVHFIIAKKIKGMNVRNFVISLLSLCFVLLVCAGAYAQNTRKGIKVNYEVKDYHFSKPHETVAYFTAENTLYTCYKPKRKYKVDMEGIPGADVSEAFNFYKILTDYPNQEIVYQRTLEDSTKLYAVEPLPDLRWKFTGNEQTILGYPCQEAVLTVEEQKRHPLLSYASAYHELVEYRFWYTPALPVKDGFLFYTGLPGLVVLPNGDIQYNGKTINKVLVNGREVSDVGAAAITRSIDPSQVESVELRTKEKDRKLKNSLLDRNELLVLDVKLKEETNPSFFGRLGAEASLQAEEAAAGAYANLLHMGKHTAAQVIGEQEPLGITEISIYNLRSLGSDALAELFKLPADFEELKQREGMPPNCMDLEIICAIQIP